MRLCRGQGTSATVHTTLYSFLYTSRAAEERLRASEEEQRKQLEAQKTSRDRHMTLLAQKKDQEIEAANQKVKRQHLGSDMIVRSNVYQYHITPHVGGVCRCVWWRLR